MGSFLDTIKKMYCSVESFFVKIKQKVVYYGKKALVFLTSTCKFIGRQIGRFFRFDFGRV